MHALLAPHRRVLLSRPCARRRWRVPCLLAVASFLTALASALPAIVLLAPPAQAAHDAGGLSAPAAGHAAAAGTRLWAKTYGPAESVSHYADIAVGRDGRVYCAGAVSEQGTADLLVTCYDSSGARLWARRWGKYPIEWGMHVVVAATGAVYVAGAAGDTGGASETVLLKYAPSGALQWTRTYSGPTVSEDRPHALATDSSGNAYVLATGMDAIGTHRGAVILKYSAAGDLRWERRLEPDPTAPSGTHIIPADLALDGARDVYVAVNSLYPPDDVLGSLVKLSGKNGAELAQSGGLIVVGTKSRYTSLTVRGSAVVTGGWYHPWDAPSPSMARMLVERHDLDLTLRWVVADSGATDQIDYCADVTVDAAGNAYAAGTSYGQGATGPVPRATLLGVSPLGHLAWKQTFVPGLKEESVGALVAVSGSDVYLAGTSTGDAEKDDFLVAAYSTAGAPAWTAAWKGKGHGYDAPTAMVAVRGSLYVAGYSGGSPQQAVLIRYAR
jgi:hypothetical protein